MSKEEQVYFGGDIYTVDDLCPRAEAVAVREGKIIAVGSKANCLSGVSKSYEPVDLHGCALLPGFIDTHLHPALLIFYNININLNNITSIKDLQHCLRQADLRISKDRWIYGMQFDEQKLKDPKLPTRHDLDTACPDRPVLISNFDSHIKIANTKAIQLSGVTASTPDPEGGVIDREPDGYPAGPFREHAARIPLAAMPLPGKDVWEADAPERFGNLAACGITSFGGALQTDEYGPAGVQGAYEIPIMQMLLKYLPMNLYSLLFARKVEQITAVFDTPLHKKELGAGHRIGALKMIVDGTLGSCTAYMREPYSDHSDKSGFMLFKDEEIYNRMSEAHNVGLQIEIHAIGDAANRKVINLYDRLLKEYPRLNHRHRIQHASILYPDMIADIARLGLVVSTQPMNIRAKKTWVYNRIGKERAQWMSPFRSLLDAGVRLAGASDAPIYSTNVMASIECCVTRDGFEPQQALNVAEAIRMYTIDAAYAQFEESVKGSLSVGKRADMVILSHNPTSLPSEEIHNISVEQTIVGGKSVYRMNYRK
jgi:predicted amidohydrolase YtcJ